MRTIMFLLLLLSLSACSKNKKKHVGLQLYGSFDTTLADTVANTLHRVYGFQISVLEPIEIPKNTFTRIKTPRYRADKLIKILKNNKPDSLDYVMGLIQKDISTTKRGPNGKTKKPISKYQDWGIFGLGYRPGVSCIVSTFRFKNSSKKQFLSRLKKICIHELGHNLGLKHCPNKKCVMTDAAESIKTIDHVALQLCALCLDKI